MRDLGAELAAASGAADWDRLALAVRALPQRLRQLAGAGPLRPAEREALAALRAAHEQAEAACARAAGEMAARLDEMQRNKQGWMAYALEGDAGPDEGQR